LGVVLDEVILARLVRENSCNTNLCLRFTTVEHGRVRDRVYSWIRLGIALLRRWPTAIAYHEKVRRRKMQPQLPRRRGQHPVASIPPSILILLLRSIVEFDLHNLLLDQQGARRMCRMARTAGGGARLTSPSRQCVTRVNVAGYLAQLW
jgi:hypothetical protein